MPRLGARMMYAVACLFFAVANRDGSAQQSAGAELDELWLAVDKLRAENVTLKEGVQHREDVIRLLTENLAIVRTESELYQQKWAEARLRAETLGVDFSSPAATHAQRQLVESMRALYLAEVERQRLVDQLQRLVKALESGGNLSNELARTRGLLERRQPTEAPGRTPAVGATLDAAQIVDVNADLRLTVLNVGAQQGVRVGMPWQVLHGDRVVAELMIVEVRPRVSGALIEKQEKGIKLAAGDAVRVKKN